MSKFSGTASYYSQYRPGIPNEVAQKLVMEANRVASATTLLDLGTGTGQVIQAIHQTFVDIIAVDPDKKMLEVAERNFLALGSPSPNVRFYQCRAEEFTPPPGWAASLVTICRAFHWMDQGRVLRQLDEFVLPTGVVAVFGDRSFWEADSPWKEAIRQVIQEFLGEQRRAGDGVFSHHNRPYSEILKESPFCRVEEIIVPVQRLWNADSILGYLYSTSFAAPPLFGDRIDQFETAVRAELAKCSVNDVFDEHNEFVIRFGRRAKV